MLAILTTHPIQYQVPLWQALAKDGRVPFEVWYLTSHATKKSHDVEFGKEFSWDLDMLAGYPHHFLDVARGATPNSFWKCRLREKLRDRLRTTGARALWINGWQVAAYWQAVREAKAAGVEVWLRGESNDLAPTPAWKMAIKRRLLGQLFQRVDRFLYIGSANKRLYQKFGMPGEKLFPAPYAVDDARFAKQAGSLRAKREELRDAWSIPNDAFVILFCGKFIPKKRPMDLIAAIRLLGTEQGAGSGEQGTRQGAGGAVQGIERGARSTVQGEEQGERTPSSMLRAPTSSSPSSQLRAPGSVHLLFAGSGELGDAVRNACDVVYDAEQGAGRRAQGGKTPGSQLPAPGSSPGSALPAPGSSPSSKLPAPGSKNPRASFAGFLNQTEVSRAYVAADVLVLPSDYSETWGLVINEAMASDLPCIISDRCGCAEDLGLIAPNAIYECGNIESLTRALMRFEQPGSRMVATSDLKKYSFDETVSTIARIWSC